MRVAVVGAGMAGLACAAALRAGGASVAVFDKGQRVGGRLATRQVDGFRFDHGAQYASARDPAFRALIDAMVATGDAAVWADAGATAEVAAESKRWVGVPGMSAMAAWMERQGVGTVHVGRHVAFLHRARVGWMVRHADAAGTPPGLVSESVGEVIGPFDQVVVAVPGPQVVGLLRDHEFGRAAAGVAMAPCWTLMLGYSGEHGGVDVVRPASGPLSWIARKRRAAGVECWVAQAGPDWSAAHLEAPAGLVHDALLEAFRAATGVCGVPVYAATHRWRYARVERPLGEPALWDAAVGLGVCGDWCLGARVEAAFLSGRALARTMLG